MVILVFLFSLIFITLSTVSAVSASSSVIYVNGSHGNDANDGLSWATAKLTIKNATGTVAAGGTVNIANGVYRGAGNTNIIINKSMTIKGQSKSGTIINGTNRTRIFQIKKLVPTEPLPSEDINVILQNLTIAHGNATNGGAISNEGVLTVKGCIFKGNIASTGGAIYNTGTLYITENIFTRNSATGTSIGGAIYNTGELTVNNNAFTGNSAYEGGAIYNTGTLTAHFNRIFGYEYDKVGEEVFCVGSGSKIVCNHDGTVDAELNWWGHNSKPTNVYPSSGIINPSGEISGFTVNKWFILKLNANTSSVPINTNSKITADLRYDNYGTLHTEAYLPNGIPVTFTTNLGTISSKAYTVNGIAQSTLKSALGGTANVSTILDAQQLFKYVKVIDKVPPKVNSTYPKNLATGCSRTSTIYLKFNEKIKASTYWSKIYVKNLKTGKKVVISKSISGNTLYIKMSSRRYAYNWYQVYIPKAAVKDYFNNNLATYYTFKFKTGKYPLNYQ